MTRINLIHPSELCDKYLSKMLYNDYTPTDAEINLNISRIIDRILIKAKFTHRQEPLYLYF